MGEAGSVFESVVILPLKSLYFIEGIKRSPLSLATQEFVQQIGFVVLAMMVGLAFWNDLSGQWAKFIEWLSNEL